jgi:deoxyribose-phosphate aldolase
MESEKHVVDKNNIASLIQFTNIAPGATRNEIESHLELCLRYQFQAAMIAPCWVPVAKEMLSGTSIKVASFFDFGMGNMHISGKLAMLESLLKLGVDEVDFAPNMGFLLSGMFDEIRNEAESLVKEAGDIPLKVMLQLGMIKEKNEKVRAIQMLEDAGVDWIKNSSGGWPPGATDATVEDITLIRESIRGKSKIKASGGIKTYNQAITLIHAGAELLGTSNGVEIIKNNDASDTCEKDRNHKY